MEKSSNPHHLVLGELTDFLTGSVLTDTYDERYCQKIAQNLILEKRFEKTDIERNISLAVCAGERKAMIKIDFVIRFQQKVVAIIKYAPGSLVTRRLSTLALSRIFQPYQIPIVIITNGEDAEILDGDSGKVVATGLENLPLKNKLRINMASYSFKPVRKTIFEQASRIAYACEVDDACPCDTDVCRIE